MQQWFPSLPRWLNKVPDPRAFYKYSMSNMLSQGLFLFLSGESSRNAANNRAEHGRCYKDNFSRLFEGMDWAHLDSAEGVFRQIKMEEVEEVKTKMIRSLIKKRRISSFYGRYLIAIDATGVTTYDEDRKGELLYRCSKDGKKTYLNIILEAKIVTPEGLSFSIGSEPLSNAEIEAYQKQDCELKAFKRMAAKIKKNFPRLPVCLLVDGLYTNNTVFDICEANQWKYIVTLKDGSLSRLQEAVADTEEAARLRFEQPVKVRCEGQATYGSAHYQCIENLHHQHHNLNWIECTCPLPRQKDSDKQDAVNRFVYLTNLRLPDDAGEKPGVIMKIVKAGRLRWKIENEGFNTQKNHGYHLHHKFSRHSVTTLHVYYILMQIAHIINQLVQHTGSVIALRERYPKLTIRYLWDKLRHIMEDCRLCYERLTQNKTRCQIRLE